jgi:putative ABC transport system permease protein
MLRNYFKVALRNIARHKTYSFINIFGLATGISCFVLILLFIQDEVSYDRFHTKAGRIYRVIDKIDTQVGQGEESSSNPFPVAISLKNDYPHLIDHAVRFFNLQAPTLTLRIGDTKYNEKRVFFADSNLLQVFDFPLASGDPAKVLGDPNSIVLTQSLARKYFGDTDAVGKTIRFEGIIDLTVTGVFEPLPDQSHIHFDCLISFGTLRQLLGPNINKNWVWNPCWTYVLLKDGVKPEELESQFPTFIKKYYPDFIKPQVTHYLQPLTDIHLRSRLDYEIEPNSDESGVYIFAVIGIFILVIACINFMNLATARSANRAREVGMRKVLGAHRSQLIRQFLGESVMLSFMAVALALVLIELFLPVFNSISGKHLSFELLSNPLLLGGLLAVGVLTGLLSGIYPAFFLSSFQPVNVLKGGLKAGSRHALFRQILVVVQFAISLALIISTLIIYSQYNYLRSADLGFDKEQVIVMPTRPPIVPKYQALKAELMKNKNVMSMATMNEIMGEHHNTHEYSYEGMQPDKWIYFPALLVNETFVETFRLKLVAGRDFSEKIRTDDSLGVLINEAMVKHLNWGTPQNALGKQFFTPLGKERVIGVLQDFNFVSLENPIGPFVIDMPGANFRNFFTKYIAVRVAPGDLAGTIAYVQKTWNTFAPEYPFEYFFLDQDLEKLYRSQENMSRLLLYFSILAIFIACLGLFALASFTAEQRTKEIGIRKVFGASVSSVVGLLSKEFLKLVLISNLVAWPLTWYIMHRWLGGFAYHVKIDLLVFVLAALTGLVIAMATVAFQAVKAAVSNPVKSLRNN